MEHVIEVKAIGGDEVESMTRLQAVPPEKREENREKNWPDQTD